MPLEPVASNRHDVQAPLTVGGVHARHTDAFEHVTGSLNSCVNDAFLQGLHLDVLLYEETPRGTLGSDRCGIRRIVQGSAGDLLLKVTCFN
jgi:hypothetical protein